MIMIWFYNGLITVLRYLFCPHTIGRYLLNYNVFMFHNFMMYVVSYSKIILAYIVFDCDTHSLCRWPWNLFRLMRVPLGQARGDRAAIATQLLNADEGSLESATKTIRKQCLLDIRYVSNTGRFPLGSRLHAMLATIALNLRLDSGSLESLNSMIKSSMSLASNTRMSLELLSSRVNSRKSCTLMTAGATSLKAVRPVLESLGRSVMFHQGSETSILEDAYRWTPPQPVKDMVPNSPHVYDPSLSLSVQQKWAVRFHRQLLQYLRKVVKHSVTSGNKELFQCLRFSRVGGIDSVVEYYLVAELTARTCQAVKLHSLAAPSSGDERCQMPAELKFTSMLDYSASFHGTLREHRKASVAIELVVINMFLVNGSVQNPLVFNIVSTTPMFSIRYRKPREAKPKSDDPAPAILDAKADSSSDDDEDHISREVAIQEAMLL